MPKFKIKYVYERWYDVTIEAPNEQEAVRKFWDTEFIEEPVLVGGEIQDGIDIEKVES